MDQYPTSRDTIYISKFAEGSFELIANTEEEMYVLEDGNAAGLHTYYVTAIYEEGESNPSNQVEITFTTPAPTSLVGEVNGNSVELSWTEPNGGLNPMADLMGYNIYHKEEGGSFEMLDFVEMPEFMHEDITTYGTHSYYVIAVFEGGESNPSNIVDVQLVISGIEEELSNTTAVYPNPASDLVNIQSEYEMKSVKIFNQSGQVLKVQQLNSKNQQINITDIPAGLYVFVINTEQGTISKRIFIQ